ncbi:hypothetical protein [Phaeobacter sp.]|uniref:hypothetical protein n=1 Tax=Phaeobacter sp. TaxID=1902409 RepID=UPI0025CBC9F4|nr:hypothetical protein [Phaeobacter sp.]
MKDLSLALNDAPVARDMADHQPVRRGADDWAGAAKPLLAILLYVLLWALAIAVWGLPGLFLPAVAKTFAMVIVLVLITRG